MKPRLKGDVLPALARLTVVAVAVSLLAVLPTRTLSGLPPLCVFKNLFGVECPGCGMTRAFSCLLHGDLQRALAYNALVVLAFPLALSFLIRDCAVVCESIRKHRHPRCQAPFPGCQAP